MTAFELEAGGLGSRSQGQVTAEQDAQGPADGGRRPRLRDRAAPEGGSALLRLRAPLLQRDNRLATETALNTQLTSRFSLKTSFVWKHVGQPPPNAVKDDTITAVALIANF